MEYLGNGFCIIEIVVVEFPHVLDDFTLHLLAVSSIELVKIVH